MINALTIDVEDYFQVNAFARTVRLEQWDSFPLRVDGNTRRILDLLDSFAVSATFFVLGWVAERLPGLVKEIQRRGHEVACHGYNHELIYLIGPERFRADIRRSKALLEDQCGVRVNGYRAPSYSITKESLWALDILVEEGFSYDSSIFPIMHDVYGIPEADRFPHFLETAAGPLVEFPLSTWMVGCSWKKIRLPIAGGGYLRLLPVQLFSLGMRSINERERQPAVLYFHPWEIDPGQPRIKAGARSTFRHYQNLARTEGKLKVLLQDFNFCPMKECLDPMLAQLTSRGKS